MLKPDRDTIKETLKEPNGAMRLAEDPRLDKLALLDETAAMYIEEGLGSALLVRMLKSRTYMLRLSGNPEILPAIRKNLSAPSPKLRRNSAQLLSRLSREDADIELIIERLGAEETRFVLPSLLLSLGAMGGPIASAALAGYTPAPPADESERTHYDAEREALRLARVSCMKHEKHAFLGLDRPRELELTAPDRLSEPLREELEELGFHTGEPRRASLNVKTSDYAGLFEARCFSEALFPIARGVALKPSSVAPLAKKFMLDFMQATHGGEPPYRYRIEIEGEMDGITAYKHALRDLIDDDAIVNAPSDYELELRVVAAGDASRLYLKLYTVPDERFFYRRQTVPASMNPATAAAMLRFGMDYLTSNARVLDPCCGSGTLLFERGLLSPCSSLTGVDIAHKAIDAARANAEAAAERGMKQAKFICNDILRFEANRPYDELICNLPFGNRVGTHSSCEKLYGGLLDRMPRLVRSGGVALLYTMEFTLLKRLIRERPELELIKQERTEAGGLTPMIFLLRIR